MAHDFELEFAAKTDTGKVRPHNEDVIAVSESCGIAIVADGMGGYNAGEVASRIAASVLKESLEERLRDPEMRRSMRSRHFRKIMADCIVHANASIIEAARREPRYNGMGTTLVAALFHRDKVTIAHIGDSRAYRFRKNRLMQLTRDHSVLQEQIDAGMITEDEAPFAPNRNLITRALGVDHEPMVEIHDHSVESEDIYLLCSDGLSDMLSRQEIVSILADHQTALQTMCGALIAKALDKGGYDNISALVIAARDNLDRKRGGNLDLLGLYKKLRL